MKLISVMKKIIGALLVFGLLVLAFSASANGQRAIPDDNLAYPVLIMVDDKSAASGFYLNTGKSCYLVTAKHVLYKGAKVNKLKLQGNEATLVSYPPDPNNRGLNVLILDLATLDKGNEIKYHNIADVAVIKIGEMIEKDGKTHIAFAKWIRAKQIEHITTAGIKSIKRFDEVLTGNDVFVFGYPTSLGIKKIPQLDYGRPLLRKGIVAGRNRKLRTIILDVPTYGGNSGGPVLEVDRVSAFHTKYRVIGVVSGFVPYKEEWVNLQYGYSNAQVSNSGYSVVVPMDMVFDLISE